MFKQLAIICLLFTVAVSSAEAKPKKKKSKKTKSSRQYKPAKHSRKSRRFSQHHAHHGGGPDLKTITTESTYTENPTNGVTPVETKQPGL